MGDPGRAKTVPSSRVFGKGPINHQETQPALSMCRRAVAYGCSEDPFFSAAVREEAKGIKDVFVFVRFSGLLSNIVFLFLGFLLFFPAFLLNVSRCFFSVCFLHFSLIVCVVARFWQFVLVIYLPCLGR